MLAGFLTGALLCAASLVVGQAAMTLLGRREPSVLAPAAGLAILLVVADLSIRLPGRASTAAVALAAVTIAAGWVAVLGRVGSLSKAEGRLPPGRTIAAASLAALLAALAVAIPFLVNGRMGPLGQGLVNDDMASHLLFTEWVANHQGRPPDLVTGGYPLAPHSLVAGVSRGTGASYIEVFAGLTLAIASLMALTAFGALSKISSGWRGPAAALAALPYLAAAWLAQGAFKEPMLGLFIVAFALGLEKAENRRDWIALGIVAAGALYAYSFPGLVWLMLTAGIWGLLELLRRETKIGDLMPGAAVAAAVVIAAALPQIGRMIDFASFGAFDPEGVGPKVGFGNLRQALNAFEGLGIWPVSDFRVSADLASIPAPALYLGGVLAAAAIAWALVVAWREKQTGLPAALAAVALMYAGAKVGGTAYTSAKALAIASPVVMLVTVRGLLGHDLPSPWPALAPLRAPLAAAFLVGAVTSSFLPLRAGAVGPADHGDQLRSFRAIVGKGPVLYLGRDQFAAAELYHARLGTPVLNHYNVKGLPNRFPSTDEFVKLDWDGLSSEQLDQYPFAITTRSSFQSWAPANFSQRAATGDYILWQREGPTPARRTLSEPDQPGSVLKCKAGDSPGGTATVLAGAPVIGPAENWMPSTRITDAEPASQSLALPAGHWEISLEYVSTQPLRLRATGFEQTLPANLDFRGPTPAFPSGGEIAIDKPRAVKFNASVERPPLLGRLIGAESVAFPLRIVATPAGAEEQIPAAKACGRYVDFLTPP